MTMKVEDVVTLEDARKWLVYRAMEKYEGEMYQKERVAIEIGVGVKTVYNWLKLWEKD